MSNSNLQHNFVPFTQSNAHVADADKLQSVFAEDGYLFLRDFVSAEAAQVRDDIIGVLKRHSYVTSDATEVPTWSGKWPDEDEELQCGVIAEEIGQLRSIAALSTTQPLIELLERLLGGDVFNFVENMDRIRRVFPIRAARELIEKGEPIPDATPAHQDDSFYNIPFVSVWIALMEIDEATGGLALRQGAHKLGKLEHWWQSKDMLGVAESTAQARHWAKQQASVTWGDVTADDSEKIWLRSNYDFGDVLIFHPWMVHRGFPNVSDRIRLSSDFRYQRQGDPEVWWIRHRLSYRRAFITSLDENLVRANLEPAIENQVRALMRDEGPPPGGDEDAIQRRIQELAAQKTNE